jgi:inorganic phosphate transporter, PiT family
LLVALAIVAVFVAYTNGANSNFKGVATLHGSGLASYKVALGIGTLATFAGGILSAAFATTLLKKFSGSGLLHATITGAPEFLLSVGLGAVVTVSIATRIGMPVSTTHALIGGLGGAGFLAAGAELNLRAFWQSFVLPLAISPAVSAGVTVAVLLVEAAFSPTGLASHAPSVSNAAVPSTGASEGLVDHSRPVSSAADVVHLASAIAVSFARGFGDVPKIAALLATSVVLNRHLAVVITCIAMALGGVLHARRVALTMSKRVSQMEAKNAALANIITAALVIGATQLGAPVSTTHVVVGCIFGIGIVNGTLNRRLSRDIILSWVFTVPVAGTLAAAAYRVLSA